MEKPCGKLQKLNDKEFNTEQVALIQKHSSTLLTVAYNEHSNFNDDEIHLFLLQPTIFEENTLAFTFVLSFCVHLNRI